MLKVGLIGLGFMGATHNACYTVLSQTMDVKVTALSDIVPEKLNKAAERWPGAEKYSSGMELIEKADVDVIDICLPTYLHCEHGVAAMDKGRDCFIEKPVCLTREQGDALLEAQKRNSSKVMVGQVLRVFPEYNRLKAVYDSGEYGKLRSLVMCRVSPRPEWAWDGWLHDINRSGSMIMDLHVHDVDFLNYMLGHPDDVRVACMKDAAGTPQQSFTTYKYKDGPIVNIEAMWDYPSAFPFEASYRACFEKGTVTFNTSNSPTVVEYLSDGTVRTPDVSYEYDATDDSLGGNVSSLGGYFAELKLFVECLINGKPIENAPLSAGVDSAMLVRGELEMALKEG